MHGSGTGASDRDIDSLPPAQIAVLRAVGITTIDVSGLTGAGPLTIGGGITLAVSGAVPSNQTITFSGAGGVLELGDPIDMAGTIYGFAPADTIDLTGAAYDATAAANLNGGNALVITEISGTYTLQLDPLQIFLTTPTFVATADAGSGTDINVVEPAVSGYVQVAPGYNADGVVVVNGGTVDVQSGGTVNGGTVNGGGVLLGESGATINDAVINSGGLLNLTTGSAGVGTITFSNVSTPGSAFTHDTISASGGRLEIDDTKMPGATIAGFAAGDMIDLTAIVYDPGGSDTIEAGNVVAISSSGGTYTLQLDPSQIFLSENFTFSMDAGVGTDIGLVQMPFSGNATISFGQYVDGITVASGGTVEVQAGGTINDAVINSGGTLELTTGGSTSGGPIPFATVGGTTTNNGTLYLDNANVADNGVLLNNSTVTLDLSTLTLFRLIGTGTVFAGAGSTLNVAEIDGTANLSLGSGNDSVGVAQGDSAVTVSGLGSVGGSATFGLGSVPGAASVEASGGQTTIMAGAGDDTVSNTGPITIHGSPDGLFKVFAATASAIAGATTIQVSSGQASITAGAGSDTINISQQTGTVLTESVGSSLNLSATVASSGAGVTTIFWISGAATVEAGPNDKSLSVGLDNIPAMVWLGPAAALITIGGTVGSPLDIIYTGTGSDTLVGGGSATADYVFTNGNSPTVVIENLNIATDSLALLNFPGTEVANLFSDAVVVGGSTDVTLSDGTQITLAGVTSLAGLQISNSVACFAVGTWIATPKGNVAVEALTVGDSVSLAAGGMARVAWIGHREVDATRHPAPRKVWPVRISAGAFGAGQPHRDLFLSPDHAVFVEDVLIPVKYLINASTIVQVPVDAVTYYHIELPRHDVLLAEGLPVESYLETGDRSNFANGGGVLRLFPDFASRRLDTAPLWEAYGYARLIVCGPELEAARQQVNSLVAAAPLVTAVARPPQCRSRRQAKRAIRRSGRMTVVA